MKPRRLIDTHKQRRRLHRQRRDRGGRHTGIGLALARGYHRNRGRHPTHGLAELVVDLVTHIRSLP